MHKPLKFVFARAVCACLLFVLVGCRGDRTEWHYASLADVKKADAGAQSWVPDDLLPASAHSIRIAGELSPSYEWGSFEFIPADSQALLRNLTSVDVLPQSVRNVRNPRVSWWPSLLIGDAKCGEDSRGWISVVRCREAREFCGYYYFPICPRPVEGTRIFLFDV